MLLKNALARSTTPPQQSQHTPFTPSPAPYMPEWCELVLKANYDAEGIPERYRNYPSVIKCKECSKPGKPSLLTSHDSSNLRKHKRLHRVKPSTAPSDTKENETFDLSVVISARSLAESCVTAGLNFAQAENVARVHNRIIDRREISLEADRMIKNFDEWLRGYLAGQHFFFRQHRRRYFQRPQQPCIDNNNTFGAAFLRSSAMVGGRGVRLQWSFRC